MRTIGILGGMGPEATAELYLRIVRIFQQKYDAKYDGDFPPFFICSVPIPDIVSSLENEERTISMLRDGCRKLEAAGAQFIVIPCNTAHIYLDTLRESVGIPIISIMDEAVSIARDGGFSTVGVLGTEQTIKRKLFQRVCLDYGITLLESTAEQQAMIQTIILSVLAGKNGAAETGTLCTAVENLRQRGAQAIILGCTELPLAITQADTSMPLLDTLSILADAAVRESKPFKQEINGSEQI